MADGHAARAAGPLGRGAGPVFDIPFLDLPPLRSASGTVRLPGSKSISNRVLLLAALAEGETCVHEPLQSDDTRVMLDALRALGCTVRADERGSLHCRPGWPPACTRRSCSWAMPAPRCGR